MYHDEQGEEVLSNLGSRLSGLTAAEVTSSSQKYGSNIINEKKQDGALVIFIRQFKSFIIYILIGATLLSRMIGEILDSVLILLILLLIAFFGFMQEYKAQKSIAELKKISGLMSTVMREGKEIIIPGADVVVGDILLLNAGDKVSADVRLLEVSGLETDESSLTGESTSVHKTYLVQEFTKSLGEQNNIAFSGTTIVKGSAKGVVVRVGMASEIGKIAKMISEHDEEETSLQKKLNALGKKIGAVLIVICIVAFFLGLLLERPDLSGFDIFSWQSYLLFFTTYSELIMMAIALMVAGVPESLAAVVTLSLAIGVTRMAKKHALIRRLPSVETLGATTVICTDKTGTLTRNEMTVRHIYADRKLYDVTGTGYATKGEFSTSGTKIDPSLLQMVLRIGALANSSSVSDGKVIGDPTEAALLISATKAGHDIHTMRSMYPKRDELPFDSNRKFMATLHGSPTVNQVYVKGAPDVVLGLCNRILLNGVVRQMTDVDKELIIEANEYFADNALRVLGFAYKETSESSISTNNLIFAGLQAMRDPPRESARAAISRCASAGIKVCMITGDYKATAVAIGNDLGLTGRVLTGAELDDVPDLTKIVEEVSIYARVNPEHKLRIVRALQAKGHIVAMTGDGVNDAPALEHADIGISMGRSGTEVAKEASDMILTDDRFASIVDAVEEGRSIDDSIKKFVNFLLSSNIAEVMVIFVAMLIGIFSGNGLLLPLTAVQLLWINLVTDGLPALALGVDPASRDIMKRPPKDPKEPILGHRMLFNIGFIGLLLMGCTLYLFFYGLTESVMKAQTMAFTALVVFEVARVYMIRSHYQVPVFSNVYLFLAIVISLLLQVFVVYFRFDYPWFIEKFGTENLFGTVPLSLIDWGYIAGCAVGMFVIGQIVFALSRRFK